MPLPSLCGQHVVVIGGASGIGYAVAECALAEGAAVVIGSRQADRVAAAAARLGAGATGAVVDANDEASVETFLAGVGRFDHLVFTAGDWGGPRHAFGSVGTMDFEAAGAAPGVRFWGALKAAKHAQGRIAETGSITLTDGVIAHRPRPGVALATAFAGALEHLVKALAVDLAPLRVNAVCPGLTMTDIAHAMPPEARAAYHERQLIKRGGEPTEVAQAYLYLMKAGFTTGQALVVDGGLLLT